MHGLWALINSSLLARVILHMRARIAEERAHSSRRRAERALKQAEAESFRHAFFCAQKDKIVLALKGMCRAQAD